MGQTPKEKKQEEIRQKIGALHLRLMDNEPDYHEIVGQLAYYLKDNEHYAEDVLNALTDGLGNHERYLGIVNALSPRCIKVVKRELPDDQTLSAADTEGAYHIVLHGDDDTETVVHFSRKSEQILYMLMLMSNTVNGYVSTFLRKPDAKDDAYETRLQQYDHNVKVVESLAQLVYPRSDTKGIVRDLDPNSSFTDILQKMRASLETSLRGNNQSDERIWFQPLFTRYGKDMVYQFLLSSANISLPEEMMKLAGKLPDANDYVEIIASNQPSDNHIQINDLTERATQGGDTEAMNLLGEIYLFGQGVVADQFKAFQWLKKSAEAGDSTGLSYMGTFYATGDCVAQDYKTAIDYWKKALVANPDNEEACYQLGLCYMHGFGSKKDWDRALYYLKKAAALGHIEAANEAGYILFYGGKGLKRSDRKKAFQYYLQAAKKDHHEAIRYVIDCYVKHVVEDTDQAQAYWIERAKQLDMPELFLQLALNDYFNRKYAEAYKNFSIALEKGELVATIIMNTQLNYGRGVERNPELARKLLEKGALGCEEGAIDKFQKVYPEEWKELEPKIHRNIDYRQTLIDLIEQMTPQSNQECFLRLMDAYREKFLENTYISEIAKQLSIHRPSTDDGSDGDGHRHIEVRRSASSKVGYEIVLTLANGEEVVVNSININSMMIYLLAIICSYKSGYSTEMVKSDACRAIIAQLYKMVVPNCLDSEAQLFIENFLDTDTKNNYYKTYSYRATQAIAKALGMKDDPLHYLFDNVMLKNRKILRRMLLDANNIVLPQELVDMAQKMPDAQNVVYQSEGQTLME